MRAGLLSVALVWLMCSRACYATAANFWETITKFAAEHGDDQALHHFFDNAPKAAEDPVATQNIQHSHQSYKIPTDDIRAIEEFLELDPSSPTINSEQRASEHHIEAALVASGPPLSQSLSEHIDPRQVSPAQRESHSELTEQAPNLVSPITVTLQVLERPLLREQRVALLERVRDFFCDRRRRRLPDFVELIPYEGTQLTEGLIQESLGRPHTSLWTIKEDLYAVRASEKIDLQSHALEDGGMAISSERSKILYIWKYDDIHPDHPGFVMRFIGAVGGLSSLFSTRSLQPRQIYRQGMTPHVGDTLISERPMLS